MDFRVVIEPLGLGSNQINEGQGRLKVL